MVNLVGQVTGPVTPLAALSPPPANARGAWTNAPSYEYLTPLLYGAKTEKRPVAVLTRSLSGFVNPSFFNDYYDRIWLIPLTITLGAVTADSSTPFHIWNAWTVKATLSAVIAIGDLDGVTVGGPATPFTFAPLQFVAYALNVTGQGAPVINGAFSFTFSTGDTPQLNVTGSRSFLWRYEFWPDWHDPVSIAYIFKTDIIKSRQGYEQRNALRATPRKTITFTTLLLNNDNKRLFRQLMQRAQHSAIIMPEWSRRVLIANSTAVGDTSLLVAAASDWIVAGRIVVISTPGIAELAQVLALVGNTLTLASALGNAYPAGASVIAAIEGRLEDTINGSLLASFASRQQITFAGYPTLEGPASFSAGTPLTTFDGREIMTWRPNWRTNPSQTMVWPVEVVDAGVGVYQPFQVVPFPSGTLKVSLLALTAFDQDALRQFQQRMLGQQREFFMPTYENDLGVLRQISPAGSNLIRVIGTDIYATAYKSLIHQAVLVRFFDGSIHPLKVQSVALINDSVGDDTLIEFTSNTTIDIGGPSTSSVDWLFLTRFATDKIEFRFETPQISQVDFAVQILPYQPSEN